MYEHNANIYFGWSRKAYIPNLKEKVLPGAVSSCKKKRIFETYLVKI
jgi:hypothetical protein